MNPSRRGWGAAGGRTPDGPTSADRAPALHAGAPLGSHGRSLRRPGACRGPDLGAPRGSGGRRAVTSRPTWPSTSSRSTASTPGTSRNSSRAGGAIPPAWRRAGARSSNASPRRASGAPRRPRAARGRPRRALWPRGSPPRWPPPTARTSRTTPRWSCSSASPARSPPTWRRASTCPWPPRCGTCPPRCSGRIARSSTSTCSCARSASRRTPTCSPSPSPAPWARCRGCRPPTWSRAASATAACPST